MARPRTVTDAQLIAAAVEAITQRGDVSWSLGDVARIVGVTPAALVKRFGSKQGLLIAVATQWVKTIEIFDPATHGDPLTYLRAWVAEWLATASHPTTASGHLALVLHEAADDAIRPLLQRGRRQQAASLNAALRDAFLRGQIQTAPPEDVGEAWLDLLAGAAVGTAIERTGDAAARARHFIEREIERWT